VNSKSSVRSNRKALPWPLRSCACSGESAAKEMLGEKWILEIERQYQQHRGFYVHPAINPVSCHCTAAPEMLPLRCNCFCQLCA